MATLQIRLDDALKAEAEHLFLSLGLDTSTAVRIFLKAAIEHAGLPFLVQHQEGALSLQQAIHDSRHQQNLYGPYSSAEEAVASMLAD